MKICIYAHSFPPIIGGAQTYQYNLAAGLGKLGHEVLVLTGEIPDTLKSKIKDYTSSYFKVKRIPLFRESIKMKAPFRDVLINSFTILNKFDPDIIYSNGYIPCLLISMIKDSLRAKHIFSYHSTPELDVNKLVGILPGNLEFELAIATFIFLWLFLVIK
ncbi:MAG: glycosyltransferase [Candidatus Paceibacterota bacterium]|jgi:glycosyltransferase involved in cell wall biosynthesis